MFKDITLGRYYPGNSPVHRVDPRMKILLVIAFIAAVFLIQNMWLFALAGAYVILMTAVGQIPVIYVIKSLKPLKWIIIFMVVLNLFFLPSGTVLFEWWKIKLTLGGIGQAFYIAFRLILLVAGTSLLTLTTTPIALTDGLELLLTPLKKLRFPAHELAMMMTIALTFIPLLLEESDKIMKAQLARGADFETGGLVKRAKNMIPILVPLFVSAFRRADELAMAMESRCYHGGEGRTRMRVLKLSGLDAVAALSMALLLAGVLVVQAVW